MSKQDGVSQSSRELPQSSQEMAESSHEGTKPSGVEPMEVDASQLPTPKIVSFASLAACGDEVWIENNGQLYRLRRTSQGKLILTK